MSRTPASYERATLRGTLPWDTESQVVGLSFDKSDGTVVRLALDFGSARALVDSLTESYVSRFGGSQSDTSALSPSEPRSVPSEGTHT